MNDIQLIKIQGGERVKGQVNYVKWVNPNIYNSVTLASKSMETDEYNGLVSEILHLTNQHSLSILDLESFFKQMMEDVKKNIVPELKESDSGEIKEKVEKEFSNRLRGYATPSQHVQPIIDVIETLTDRGLSVELAQAVLNDAAKIITLITNA